MLKKLIYQSIKNVIRGKKYSLITILGLSLSLVTLFHIYSFVNYETHFDTYHKKANRIYRINGDIVAAENTMTHALVGPLLGPGLKEEFPGVESFARLVPFRQSILLERDNKKYEIEEAYTVDSTVFDIFTLHFIYGSSTNALRNPNEIIINQSLSQKIFGDRNPVGETISLDNTDIKIMGVIQDSPQNVHHKLNVLFSLDDRWNNLDGIPDAQLSEGYWMPSVYTFILLKPNAKIESITNNFKPFYEKNMALFGNSIHATFNMSPVSLGDLHISKHISYDYPKGNATYTYIFSLIGIFILIAAFFNYSNLLIYHLNSESKSIMIKGILGAKPIFIFTQFLVQSSVIILAAILIALPLYLLSIPFVAQLTNIHYPSIIQQDTFITAGILFITLSFISSFIPYFLHKKVKPTHQLNKSNQGLRGLNKAGSVSVIAQFSVSIVLLTVTFFMSRQIDSLIQQDMGFDHDNVLLLKLDNVPDKDNTTYDALKTELLKIPSVSMAAFSNKVPGEIMGSVHFQIKKENKAVSKVVNSMTVGYDYLPLMNMKLKYGRNFNRSYSTDDTLSIIVNEALVDFCGLNGDITGTKIEGITVIGIVKDFCFNSLRNDVEPVVFYINKKETSYLNIKLDANAKLKDAITSIKSEWKTFYSNTPCKIEFMDNRIKMLYKDDQTKKTLIQLFMLVTYIISIMGLFNLSVLMATKRTKEIGVRKVNGAHIIEIIKLLNLNFVKWITTSFVIAIPVSWYIVHRWLETFALKINMSWWVFAITGLATILIAILAVSWQSWKAATRNPVESLRYE